MKKDKVVKDPGAGPGATDNPDPSVSDGNSERFPGIGDGDIDDDPSPDFDNMQRLLRDYLEDVSALNLESARTLLDQGKYLKF